MNLQISILRRTCTITKCFYYGEKNDVILALPFSCRSVVIYCTKKSPHNKHLPLLLKKVGDERLCLENKKLHKVMFVQKR